MVFRQTRFHGEPGTNLRSGGANNTGEGGDDPASVISPNNNAAAQFSDDYFNLLTGGTVLKVTPPGGTTHYPFRWDELDTASMSGAVQLAGMVFTAPLATGDTSEFGHFRGPQQSIRLRLQEDRVYVRGSSDLPSVNLTTHDLYDVPLCLDYVFEAHEDPGQRRLACRVRRMDDLDGTPLLDHDQTGGTGGNAGSTPVYNYWLLGGPSATPMTPYYLMGFTVQTDRTTYLPDPEFYSDPPPAPQAVMTSGGQWVPHEFLVAQDGQWYSTALSA